MRWPDPIRMLFLSKFAAAYRINLSEAEAPLETYPSIGAFFVRRLKAGVRPLGHGFFVHPADSQITQTGQLPELIQAKGMTFKVQEFLGSEIFSEKYAQGKFVTYYLCPTDYHRVHSPVSGMVRKLLYSPGQLWPVNNWSTTHIDKLFIRNEKVLIEIETANGFCVLVMVGATNVGEMSLGIWPEMRSNSGQGKQFKIATQMVEKGQEIGCFHMGSTVVMVLEQRLCDYLKSQGLEFKLGATRVGADL